ncbi:guanylate kinase [Enterococcus alishanensis]|uniref:Guanylate kinase n=1 Tax=Enterococcus alishanensis TaxID=1303817 RepID=A0ABS6TBK7_9ENTE|nr:guanylate kinase [Enterococcus alishanensis]MBV7390249.1 guanylate kinase [Enterococcus alishanensis]
MHYCYLFMGPSGSGKTTLAEKSFSSQQKIVSYTTRIPRSSEKDGLDYHFVSKKQFKQMVIDDQFAEFDVYDENYYGIALTSIKKALEISDCYDPITPLGFLNLYKNFGQQMVPVWIHISKETLAQRLAHRASPAEIKRRIALYEKDLAYLPELKKIETLIEIDGEQSVADMVAQFRKALN